MDRFLPCLFFIIISLFTTGLFAQPVNDVCEGAVRLTPFPSIQSCPGDDGVSYTETTSGTNVGGTPSSPYPILACGTSVAADVWYTFEASGAINTITVTSSSLGDIQVLGFVGFDCNNLQARSCAVSSGSTTIEIITQPGTPVYLTVAGTPDDPDDQGSFNITVTSESACSTCARSDNGEIIFNPRNQTGTYACGESVEVCFDLFEWSGDEGGSIEWLHSIVPEFGPGWDISTITPTSIPGSCDGSGSWGWYPSGWTGCNTGQVFDYGFAYETNAGQNNACGGGASNPGNNWGDGNNGCIDYPPNTQWCFSVNVKECPPDSDTFTGEDLSISISVYSDFVSGSWTQSACASPTFTTIGSVLVCDDLDPLVEVFPTSCAGVDDGSITVEGNGGSFGELFNFVIRDSGSNFVTGCDACENPQTFGNLAPGDYTVTTTGLISGCPKSVSFTIEEGEAPSADLSFVEACPNSGPIELIAEVTPEVNPGAVVTINWSGPGGFTGTGASVFTNDPDVVGIENVEGTYTVVVDIDGCTGEPIDIDVAYLDFAPEVSADPEIICFGESTTFTINNPPDGAIFEWYDQDGNQTGGTGLTEVATPTISGTVTYQVLVTDANCSELIDAVVIVADEIEAEIVMTPDGEVCSGEDIEFRVQLPGGGFFPAGWTFAWDGGPAGGSFVHTRNENQPGDYQVELIVTNPDGCSEAFSQTFTVNTPPEVTISPDVYAVCGTGTVELTPSFTGGAPPFEYLWGPFEDLNITTPTLTVDNTFDATDLEAIYVVVTDANGCISFSNFAQVSFIDALPAVVFDNCAVSGPNNEITFSWGDVGQDHFIVSIAINGGDFTEIDDEYNGLSYTATGLPDAATVQISVIPVGESVGQSCPGPENTQTCSLPDCADPAFSLDLTEACATSQTVTLSLDGDYRPTSDYTLSFNDAAGVVIVDADISDGNMQFTFTEGGTYTITLAVDNPAFPECAASATAEFTLNQPVPAPVVTCGDSDLNSLTINWTDTGADSYVVTIVDAPPGAMMTQGATSAVFTGLANGDMVTITVTAIVAGCPDVTSEAQTCIAQSCADITPVITTPVDTFCADGSAGLIDLTVDVPAAGTVSWNGPGVTGSQFDPVAAGPGFHIISVTYTEGTCMYSADFELGVVAPVPVIGLSISSPDFCLGDTATAVLQGGVPGNTTVEWILPAEAVILSGGNNSAENLVFLTNCVGLNLLQVVFDNGFCEPDTVGITFTVAEPASPAVVDCENISFDQVGFTWSQAEGLPTDFVVEDMPVGATMVQDSNSLLFTGLAEGESVTVTVTVEDGTVCSDPLPTTITCTAAVCPDVTIALDPIGPFCVNGDETIALNTVITSVDNNGTLTYLMADGVDGDNFVTTGLASGDYEIIASYTEAGCTFNDTISVTILTPPTATIDLPAGPVCTGQSVAAAAGAVEVGWSYVWDFGADAAPATATGPGPHSVSWSTPGDKTITMVPTDNIGCSGDPVLATITVLEPLAAPVVGCGVSSFTSVEFGWDAVPGAIGYEVSVDNGPLDTITETTLLVDGLNQGDIVTLTITALGDGPCGNSLVTTQPCEAGSCPVITVTPMEDMAFCTGNFLNVVTLTATQMGGSGNGTYVYTGPGVSESGGEYSFDADAAGAGVHTIEVVYNETICTDTAFITMTVTETPESPFVLNGMAEALTVCAGEAFSIAYDGPLTAADGAVFDWDFGGLSPNPTAVFENYTASTTTPGVYDVLLTVSLNGCQTDALLVLPVMVEAPLAPLVITCTASDLNSVSFSWNDVPGATGYQLADGTILDAGTTSYTVTGMLPSQDTTITLVALSDGACGNGNSTTSQPCSTAACPDLALDASDLITSVCLENGDETIDLSGVLVTGGQGNGTYTFDHPAVTGTTFDAAAAGGSEAGTVHTITVNYTEAGPCSFSATFDLTVFERPSAFITEAEPACIEEGVQLIVGSTNFVANQDIMIDFDGGTVLDDGDPDDSVYLVSWATPGTKTVTATVISNISGCPSLPVTRQVVIEEPLATPVPSCPADAELESITFSWVPVAGAVGYEVTDGNTTATLDAATTTYTVTGLSPETMATISVIALGDGPCGNSQAGSVTCETAPCPGGTVQAVTPDTELCLDGEQEAFVLEATLSEGTPSGPFVWSGTGVSNNPDGSYGFDPSGLPAGTYTLTVNYLGEANCTSSDEITVRLFDQPASAFGISASVVCTGTETTVSLTGPVDPSTTYSWDFDGAAQAAGGNESYVLSWPTAGTYTINLTAEANGCTTVSSLDVTVDEPADAGASLSDEEAFCAGNDVDIDLNEFLGGADAGGTWAVAASSPSNVGNVDVSTGSFNAAQLTAGTYIFTYSVQQGSCPPATADVSIRLLPPPVASAGPERLLTCSMGMAQLDGTGSEEGEGFTYRWYSDDPNVVIMGGTDRILDVSQPGTYFLEVTNAIGCSSVARTEVTAETEAPVMEVDVSNITCFSADDGAILVTNVSGGRAPYTFTVNGEDRGASTLFSGLMAQEYDLQITDANGCFSNLILDLTEPEELTVRLQFPGDSTLVAAGEQVTITAAVNGGNPVDTLIWMPDSLSSSETSNGITFLASETQMISITVVDELGCTATDREMLLVRKDRRVYFPNAFSPNGDNVNDIWFIGGDLDEIEYIDNFFVFDRWGEAVHTGNQVDPTLVGGGNPTPGPDTGGRFLPNDPAFGFDGRLNGQLLNPQVLVYTATVHFRDGETIVYKGDFVLMR